MPRPKTVSQIKSNLLSPALTSHYEVTVDPPAGALKSWWARTGRQGKLNLQCAEASLPGSQLATSEITNNYHGVTERYVNRRIFDDRIDLTFYVDAGLYQPIKFFEQWISFITNGRNISDGDQDTQLMQSNYDYRIKYPDSYIADQGLKITKFEKDYTDNVLEYEFVRSFPLSISSMPVSYDGSSLLKCSVSMSYIRYVVKNLHKKPSRLQNLNPLEQGQFNGGFLDNIRANTLDAGFSGLGLGANDLLRTLGTIG